MAPDVILHHPPTISYTQTKADQFPSNQFVCLSQVAQIRLMYDSQFTASCMTPLAEHNFTADQCNLIPSNSKAIAPSYKYCKYDRIWVDNTFVPCNFRKV